MHSHLCIALASLFLLAPFASAQTPVKIDLTPETNPVSSAPSSFYTPGAKNFILDMPTMGGKRYFVAHTLAHGRELWSTDGTEAGTQLAFDFNPGPGDGLFAVATEVNGRVLFLGSNGTGVKELYSTDGTAAGTTAVTGAWMGPLHTPTTGLTKSGGLAYFITGNGSNADLWVTDGTQVGTHELLADGSGSTFRFYNKTIFPDPKGSGVYVSPSVSPYYGSIWYSDGTAAGSYFLADLTPGFSTSDILTPVALGSKILFTLYGPLGNELYVSDGTPAGTKLLADLYPGPDSSFPEIRAQGVLGGVLYFSADTPATGRELFQTDGTSAGTFLVTDTIPGPLSSTPIPIGVAGGKLLVFADFGSIGRELYRLDQGVLNLLVELAPGPQGATVVHHGTALGNKLVFTHSGTIPASFITDGTAAGTTPMPVSKLGDYFSILGELQPGVAFMAGNDGLNGAELMLSDGTLAGTTLVKDIEPAHSHVGSKISLMSCADSEVLYAYLGTQEGTEFHSVQAGSPPSILLGEANTLHLWSMPAQVWLGDHGEQVFSALDFATSPPDRVLLTTDGTQAGTKVLANVTSAYLIAPLLLASNGHNMLMFGWHTSFGPELWLSDGTSAGTNVLGDLLPPPPFTWPQRAAILDDIYYVSLPDAQGDLGLWRTDGTAAGTSELTSGIVGATAAQLAPIAVGDALFFTADDGVHGLELWTSDGTVAGTKMVTDILPGASASEPTLFHEFQGHLHFFARTNSGAPKRLWRTDGTATGTVQVSTTKLAADALVAVAGEYLYFQGTDKANGKEFWAFDGISDSLVGDLTPGPAGTNTSVLIASGNRVYFATSSPHAGQEVHFADAATSTVSVAFDLIPGSEGADPEHLTWCDGSLYFAATGPDYDRELYRYDLTDAHVADLGFSGSGARLTSTLPKLGSQLTLTVTDAPPNTVGVIALSAPTEPTGSFVLPGGPLWIDAFDFATFGHGMSSTWSITRPIPNLPALAGAQLNVQAWFLQPPQLPGQTSNGLRLVLGN